MDKISAKMLNHLINSGGCKVIIDFQEGLDKLAADFNIDAENLRATIRYLHDLGYLEYMYYNGTSRAYGFYLSHKGLYWKKFRRSETINYLKDKWIDFFAVLLSFAALIVSIIALTNNSLLQ